MLEGFWFKSEMFAIQAGEDWDTNPGCFGKSLAEWLQTHLEAKGYSPEGIIPEDWGWCLMCSREDFMLWVGCGVMQNELGTIPDPSEITWHCFVVTEVPFWKFWVKLIKGAEMGAVSSKLHQNLETIFASEPRITMVDEA